jgi:hypothetical protein
MTKTLADRSRKNTVEARVAEAKIKTAGFVDLTPTWSGIVRLFMAALEDGNHTAKDAARTELTRMAALADRFVAFCKPTSTVGPDGENTRTSIASHAERESMRARYHVRCEQLSIKSQITPETVHFNVYPGTDLHFNVYPGTDPDTADRQLHVTVLQGTTGKGIFLSEADALLVRDFLNEFYPPK